MLIAIWSTRQAHLQLLKMDLDEKKIGKNTFTEESEVVWGTMKEVTECDILCTPVNSCY